MSIHSHLQYDQSTSHARIPAGGINLIASIDSVSEAQFTASFFGSTKALHGENATTSPATTTHNYSNQQYSITAVTTSAGAIAERYAYSAYGEPTILDGSGSTLSSSSINNRYTYTGREWDATVGLYHFRARWMSPKTGRFITRDPIGYAGSDFGLYEYVKSRSLVNYDPSGLIPITCKCHGYSPRDQGGGPFTIDRTTECGGLASNCCGRVCGPDLHWQDEWWIVPQPPQPEIDSCPSDWGNGTDYLTCVACCVRTYEFWNAGAIVCGVGGIRVPKPHIQPGQYPTQTWLYGPRRCLPRWCRPTLQQVRIAGRCSGILFIIEGCYDAGVEGSCAAYCAAR
jgi:RHS repeat-associated protein